VILATKLHAATGEGPTTWASRGTTSCGRSRRACGASAPTGSTCCRCTASTA
jgi:hypothetical protein